MHWIKRTAFLFIITSFTGCKLSEGDFDTFYHADFIESSRHPTEFIFVNEESGDACFQKGLDLADERESFIFMPSPKEEEQIKCNILTIEPPGNYFVKTIESKFTKDFSSLTNEDTIELSNLICNKNSIHKDLLAEEVDSLKFENDKIIDESTASCSLYSLYCFQTGPILDRNIDGLNYLIRRLKNA